MATLLRKTKTIAVATIGENEVITLEGGVGIFSTVDDDKLIIPIYNSTGTPQVSIDGTTFNAIDLSIDESITIGKLYPFFRSTAAATATFKIV
jgi:hypothetical protein